MKFATFLAVLAITGASAIAGDINSGATAEPTGGLADLALKPYQTSQQARRRIKQLFDSLASPSAYVAPRTNSVWKDRPLPSGNQATPTGERYMREHLERI